MFKPRPAVLLWAGLALVTAGGAFLTGARWERHRARPAPTDLRLAAAPSTTAFPLHVDSGRRHLAGADGKPFLMVGDAAWSLIADLTREEVEVYLADRRARGFNTLLVSLVEHRFARQAPANAYGQSPFTTPGDFSTPDDGYFRHAEWVLAKAREHGFLVLLAPAYIGAKGEQDGWWREMVANGTERMRAYGAWVGQRFRAFDHIVWLGGGDYDPPDKSLVRAVSQGIKAAAPEHLQAAHLAPETPVMEFWRDDADWMDLATVYTYGPICERTRITHEQSAPRPVFLIESFYEGEHGADATLMRSQAYQAMLCGASGQVFGNNPVWHFGHAGIYPASGTWWQNLGSPGARSMTVFADLFAGLPWWELRHDADALLVDDRVADRDSANQRGVAAVAADGTLGLVYLPSRRTIGIDLGALSGPLTEALWVSPDDGSRAPAAALTAGATGRVDLTPPEGKSTGGADWLLVLRTRSSRVQSATGAASPSNEDLIQ